jgi:TolB-like protein/DNA-binding winged helix-turn-helix (wHTH) protein
MGSQAVALKAKFAEFELDFASGELRCGDRRIRLQSQPFMVLRMLLERAGEVVRREELQDELWPGKSFGDFDHGLNKAIAKLRDALEDIGNGSKLVETLPRRGYRLTTQVTWLGVGKAIPITATPAQHPPASIGEWLTISLLAAAVLSAAVWMSLKIRSGSAAGAPQIRSIAVLPLENLSNNPEQEYFADGMTDELITDLSYVRSLRVISRVSSASFKGSHLSIPQIAEKLGVDAVIEGTVRRDNQKVQITIRLIAADPERQIWTASYESDLADAITLQNRIAAEAVGELSARLTTEERARLQVKSPINPEAHDEYLRARYFLAQETGQMGKAIPHLERAIQLEPGYASAYAALGEAWGMEGIWGEMSNRETSAKALEYSQKAVNLDPDSSQAYASLGHSLMQSHRWNEGERALRRAIELDPNNLYAQEYLSTLLLQKGRVDESVALSRQLAAANPIAADAQRTYANALYRARRYDEAIAQCQSILELSPDHLATYTTLANALVEKGRFLEAREAFRRGGLWDAGVEAWLDARSGNVQRARKLLNANSNLVNVHTAVARYLIGEKDKGIAELDYLANEIWAVKTYHLRNDPTFDPMRNDPRFLAIVKRSGLLDN